jgi:long-chain acyl-CoA synthetase
VKAIVVPASPDRPPSHEDLVAFARGQLAGYKLPKSTDIATELPRNASGKLLKRELREPYWATSDRRVG